MSGGRSLSAKGTAGGDRAGMHSTGDSYRSHGREVLNFTKAALKREMHHDEGNAIPEIRDVLELPIEEAQSMYFQLNSRLKCPLSSQL